MSEAVAVASEVVMYCAGIAATVTAPVVYLPAATAVCCDFVGVIVAAACVDNCFVFEPLTDTVPAVPLETYPALTVGVTDFDPLTLAVIRPFALTDMVGLAVIEVDGVVADPFETDFEAAEA